jgi:nucleoside triphosphate diphosphatase
VSTCYGVADLLDVMARLRDPEAGCPWDIEQSFRSIVPSTVEEVYELVDAIEREDWDHVAEELGDVMFQVVFYAQLGKEQGRFDFAQVVHSLTEKLIRRHPHVFATQSEKISQDDVKKQWEAIKQQERSQKQKLGVLDDIPTALPALTRAQKLTKRAASVGFDWPSTAQVLAQLKSEIEELEEAIASGDRRHSAEELGDVLLCGANLARHLKVDAEQCLRESNAKFERRFGYIEENSLTPLAESSLDAMDALWHEAKTKGL